MEETLIVDSSFITSILGTVGSPLIVISELIKNAIDAAADNVNIFYSRNSQSIIVIDDGLGFSLSDIRDLSKPGYSRKKHNGNLTNDKGAFYTGSKGLGLLSVFSLCDDLTIETKSDTDGAYKIRWSKGEKNYSYEQISSSIQKGTKIVLNNIYPQVMTLLTSESEVKKLRHLSTYLYKNSTLEIPKITLSIDEGDPTPLLFSTEMKGMLYDVNFSYDSQTNELMFQCLSDNPKINKSKISIKSFDTLSIEKLLKEKFNIEKTIKTRTNDNINFKDLESIEGIPTFEGRLLVFEKKTAGGMLKDYGAGVNIYTNDFALYNYLSEEHDWLGLADFSQRKKATRLKPHNVFGFVNMPHFNETRELLKISNERADFIQDSVFVKLMYLLKGVIMFIILNIDLAYSKNKVVNIRRDLTKEGSNTQQPAGEDTSPKSKLDEEKLENSHLHNEELNTTTPTNSLEDGDVVHGSDNQGPSLSPAKITLRTNLVQLPIPTGQIDLYEYLESVYNSTGSPVGNYSINIKRDGTPVIGGILPSVIEPGEEIIEYLYTDPKTGLVAESLNLVFYKPQSKIIGGSKRDLLISLPSQKDYAIGYNNIVDKLISQINSLNLKNYLELISCSLRAIFDLSIDSINKSGKFNNLFNGISSFEDRVVKVVEHIKSHKRNIEAISKSTKIDYHSLLNMLDPERFRSAVSTAHLGAHKSGTYISESEVVQLAKLLAIFVVVVNEMIQNSKINPV